MYNAEISPRKDGNRRLVSVRIDEHVYHQIVEIARSKNIPFVTALREVINDVVSQ